MHLNSCSVQFYNRENIDYRIHIFNIYMQIIPIESEIHVIFSSNSSPNNIFTSKARSFSNILFMLCNQPSSSIILYPSPFIFRNRIKTNRNIFCQSCVLNLNFKVKQSFELNRLISQSNRL